MSKIWEIIGKISVVLLILTSLISIWVFATQKREDLELHIESNPYTLNPNLEIQIKKNFKNFTYYSLKKYLKDNFPEEVEDPSLIAKALIGLHKDTWGGVDVYNFNKFNGYSFVVIKNKGTLSASDIKIDIPSKGVALVVDSDNSTRVELFNKVLSVNDIRAYNSTKIHLWTETHFSEYDYKDVNLTYKNGVGKISWPYYTTGLGRFLAEYYYFGFFPIYLIFMLGMFIGSRTTTETE